MNVGSGEDISILEVAQAIAEVVGFTGRFLFDLSKPDGTPRKLMSNAVLSKMGWAPSIALKDGIQDLYK